MIDTLGALQEWRENPSDGNPPPPLDRPLTPPAELRGGEAGVALRQAELFLDAYQDVHASSNGNWEDLFQWLIHQDVEALIQGLIRARVQQAEGQESYRATQERSRIKRTELINQDGMQADSTLNYWINKKGHPKPISGVRPLVFDLAEVNKWREGKGKPPLR